MKKIGILHGKERSFPEALVERINSKNIEGILAEPVRIDEFTNKKFTFIADPDNLPIEFYEK